jgi:lipoprotein NlpD
MRFIQNFIFACIIFSITACSTHTTAPVSDREHTSAPKVHRVKKGESLYFISWQYGLNYLEVAGWNNIRQPYNVYPGQKIYLQPVSSKKRYSSRKKYSTRPAVKSTEKKKIVQTRRERTNKKSRKKQVRVATTKKHTTHNNKVRRWIWPTRGKIIRRFSAHQSGKKGISIAGKTGQPIVASAAGKVVYSGNGLVRYGKMVIIKHNSKYLSAYAHNQRILVKEGDFVKQGQKIALMGRTGTTRNMLHFEIRYNGKPVNPLHYIK